jgi:hypothetical protein
MTLNARATYKITGFRADQLKIRGPEILTRYAKALDDQFKAEIKDPQFNWPRTTRRYGALLNATNLKTRAKIRASQDGRPYRTVGSPRDIVDSGNFLRSQTRTRVSATQIKFQWGGAYGVNYAGIILEGKTGYPPRDWIKPGLDAVPLEQFFARAWARLAK